MSKKFTRTEVASEGTTTEKPLIIIRNKVYNVAAWLGDHPGGKEILMQHAGKDATRDYEEIGHSEPAIELRDQKYLVGELVPQDHSTYADIPKTTKHQDRGGSRSGVGGGTGLLAQGVVAAMLGLYVKKAMDARAIPSVTYSAAVRHAHTLMSIGAFGSIGTAALAMSYESGPSKKSVVELHKGLGVLMGLGILARIWARFNSTIPPRFPSSLEGIETMSHYLAYSLLLYLPISGMKYAYYSGTGAPLPFLGSGSLPGKKSPEEADYKKANEELDWHRYLAQLFKYGFIPFHVIMALYHVNNGRDVVKKISPFI